MTYLIEARALRMEFGGLVAVDDVDMQIDAGEIRGLIGPNGSGKTTLLNLMSGWLRPRSGELLWKDQHVTRQSHYQLARLGIGRTFQLGALFEEMTCLQNVSMSLYASTPWNPVAGILGLRSEGRRAATIEQQAVSLLELMDILDVGDELAGSLSLGYRRWLAMAMALSIEPELLMLDEPLGGMNPVEKTATMARVSGLVEHGVTILLVEHDMNAVMGFCDRVSVLNAGQKIAEGSPETVRADQRVVDAYLGGEE